MLEQQLIIFPEMGVIRPLTELVALVNLSYPMQGLLTKVEVLANKLDPNPIMTVTKEAAMYW